MKRELELLMGLGMVMLVTLISINFQSLYHLPQGEDRITILNEAKEQKFVVVLDPGHGGWDAGKPGVNGCLEKELNLKIATYLREYLEENGVCVVMTREDDRGLYPEGSKNKKRDDLLKRCQIIEDAKADLVVSIHQNSYQAQSVCGGQVFYASGSETGEALAKKLQKRLDDLSEAGKGRKCLANHDYYLFQHVKAPIVIVECGFLSNPREADLLVDDTYQKKLAWSLHVGIMQQLHETISARE